MLQECIDGFTRNWETRVFWFNGEFLHLGLTEFTEIWTCGLVVIWLWINTY